MLSVCSLRACSGFLQAMYQQGRPLCWLLEDSAFKVSTLESFTVRDSPRRGPFILHPKAGIIRG